MALQQPGLLVVESVIPLSQDQLAQIHKQLQVKLKGITQVENRVRPELIAGLRIEFAGKVLDLSIKNRLTTLGESIG